MVFFPLQMRIIYQFIDYYDICNVVGFFFFYKALYLKIWLEFFDAVIIMVKKYFYQEKNQM